MFGKLLALFIAIPLVEMLILIKLGEVFGFWPTVMLVILTGFLGATLARFVGFRVWSEIQAELSAGRIPAEKMIDAMILFAAGIFLVTPGLLTDITGLLLLFPGPRNLLKRWLRRQFENSMRGHGAGPGPTIINIE